MKNWESDWQACFTKMPIALQFLNPLQNELKAGGNLTVEVFMQPLADVNLSNSC